MLFVLLILVIVCSVLCNWFWLRCDVYLFCENNMLIFILFIWFVLFVLGRVVMCLIVWLCV